MNWFLWLTVAWWAMNALLYVVMIGKKLEFTVGTAVTAIFLYSALISGMFLFGAK
jgi:hypothetical protein